MSNVSIVKCDSYDRDEVYQAVLKACNNTNFPEVKNKTVLVKPNILTDSLPELAKTTHPEVLRAMIRLLKEKGVKKIIVGDSPGVHTPMFKPRTCGIYKICEEENVEWVNFLKKSFKIVLPYIYKRLTLTAYLKDVDLVISLPKFKTHELMYTTGAVKNMFGLVPGFHKSPQHVKHPTRRGFARLICGLFKKSKTEFALMDAIVGMEGPGPGNGYPREIGYLIASSDAVGVDIAQATIMGHNPLDIPIIKFALKKQLTGSKKISDIKYTDLNANDLIIKDYHRIEIRKQNNRAKPIFLAQQCIHCKKCVEICPATALTNTPEKIILDEKKCVSCYCCHEICPAKAIEIPSKK